MVIYTFYNRTNTHVAEYLFVQVLIKKENQMKLLSFVALKGGVGKTTDGLCTGQGFAKKGKRVLFVDFDHQCNLSHYYDVYKDSGTVANIFTKSGEVEIVNVAPNIDLIPGSMRLDEAERQLETNPNKNMVLYDWLDLNVEKMNLIENQKDIQNVIRTVFGKKMFIYAVNRKGSIDLQQKYMNLLQLSRLPKAETIQIDFIGD